MGSSALIDINAIKIIDLSPFIVQVPQNYAYTVAVKIDQPPKKRKMFDFYFSDERC